MPPKRKTKAAKAKAATPQPYPPPAEAKRTSVLKRKSSVVQGGKTSRLQPSEPLHMTTRAASKAASNNTTPAAPSTTEGSSRRSSLNDLAQNDGGADTEQQSAKRTRQSTDSGSPPPVASQPPVNGIASINDKKSTSHRESAATKPAKRRASDDSTESSKTVSAPNGPIETNGVPPRDEKDMSEQQPRRKKRKTSATPPEEPAEPPPELTDASSPPGSPEQPPEIESGQNVQPVLRATNGEPAQKAAKRLPGRRRQPHAIPVVERDLRRQLPLKMNYRAVAKIQKAILEELSKRSLQDLRNDPKSHEKVPAYQETLAKLQKEEDDRIAELNARRKQEMLRLERQHEGNILIANNSFLDTFKTLQNDAILQIWYEMKQIHRAWKAQEGGTDDEENIIEPTRMEFPAFNGDDRLGSQYASRSRAYIETERMIDEEDGRDRLGKLVQSMAAEDSDMEDSLEKVPAGFAQFTGPPRDEALASYNINTLAEAAAEVANIIPNEKADALFLLASLSADRPLEAPLPAKQKSTAPPTQVATPAPQAELQRQSSPFAPMSTTSTAMSLETARSSPTKAPQLPDASSPIPPPPDSPIQLEKEPEREPESSRKATPVKLSTHRIMDILNDDQDIAPSRSRDSRSSVFDHTPSVTPSRRPSFGQSQHPSQNGTLRMDALVHSQDQSTSQENRTSSEGPTNVSHQRSPSQGSQFWSSKNLGEQKEHAQETLPDKNPLDRIKRMLEAKKPAAGENPSTDGYQPSSQGSQGQQASHGPSSRRDSMDRANMAPPLARTFSIIERPDSRGETRRPAVASPPTAPFPYNHSPHESHATPYGQPSRQNSIDHSSRPHWNDGRRMSGSHTPHQAQPQPYSAPHSVPHSAPHYQPYSHDYGRPGSTPTTHHSPYPPMNAMSVPPTSQPLPAKPPVPAPPVNYRFAHYEPATRSPYAHGPPPSYPPVSHAGPHTGPPPPQQYPAAYGPPQHYQGYVPPPGSFQAPPPPPPQQMSAYPPLKIHQYGGQPILPANMAPPPPQQQQQQQQQQQAPISPYGPPPPHSLAPAFQQQPPASGPPKSHYEQQQPPVGQQQQQGQQGNEPRPRRQYRSWHPPGTEFRNYQGPNQTRRRGG